MSTLDIRYPPTIHPARDARNGMYPDTAFYGWAVSAENHIVAYRKKEVFRWTCEFNPATVDDLGQNMYWRFRTGYGATELVMRAVLAAPLTASTDQYVSGSITIPGGATTNFSPDMHAAGATAASPIDAPDTWRHFESRVACSGNTTYEGLIATHEYARLLSLVVFEESDQRVDDTTDYYNEQTPQAKAKIYSTHRTRLLQGLTNMWLRNGGIQCNWSLRNTASYTRTSATAINLIDNTTTGTPTAHTPGWTLDLAQRKTISGAGVPCVLAVYGSMASGTGTVRVTDTSGTSPISVSVNSATPGWFTATGNLSASNGKKYDPMFLSDGTNLLTVLAVSLYEADS